MTDMNLHRLLTTLNGHLNRDEAVPTDLQAELVAEGVDVETYIENYEPDYLDPEWTTTLETMEPTEVPHALCLPLW